MNGEIPETKLMLRMLGNFLYTTFLLMVSKIIFIIHFGTIKNNV
jgi:hypothetical protein